MHAQLNPPTHPLQHPPPCRSYINGKPFVVRESERPFSNLEYTGIGRARVEGMEARLKQDVLQEVGWGWLFRGTGVSCGAQCRLWALNGEHIGAGSDSCAGRGRGSGRDLAGPMWQEPYTWAS